MPSGDKKGACRIIDAVAPIRICDIGGWTDTWFAGYGKVLNIGVYPYAEVQIAVRPVQGTEERIIINAENYGDRYAVTFPLNDHSRHPLLEAAIDIMNIPGDVSIEVTIHSDAPAGASTGTSAAVTVALIGALNMLTPERMTARQIAATAHRVEVEKLHRQSGIQDQLCSAYGGINFIDMFEYPKANVLPIHLSDAIWWELERRLVLVYLGKSHDSSAIHSKVIEMLQDQGPDTQPLVKLRHIAEKARDALVSEDLSVFAGLMTENTQAQRELHDGLLCADAQQVIEIAKMFNVIGWKVNGAGGEGGSLTLFTGDSSAKKRSLINAIETQMPRCQCIPTYLSRYGLRVWEHQTSLSKD